MQIHEIGVFGQQNTPVACRTQQMLRVLRGSHPEVLGTIRSMLSLPKLVREGARDILVAVEGRHAG